MGTWGPGAFENDTAMDFADGLVSLEDIASAFSIETPEQPIDADEACRIVAAAECIAALRGHPAEDLPDNLVNKLADLKAPGKSLFHHARDHLSAVISRSELAELWAEDDPADWNRAITDLMQRLNRPAAGTKLRKRKKQPFFNPSPCAFCDQPMGEEEFSMFDITVESNEVSSMRLGKWAHLKCLNAALHPKHMVQHWVFDEGDLAADVERILQEKPSLD
ncbi:MAG TPA: DUF4259 domain-containing protein [Sphingomonadaceae bacterium]|nr:DUF4259 domain-containing protein [Sphingomonadaceae bacterium]